MHLVNVDSIRAVVMCWEDCVDLILEGQELVNCLHSIAPVAGGHGKWSRNARDHGPEGHASDIHDCVAHHDRSARDVKV